MIPPVWTHDETGDDLVFRLIDESGQGLPFADWVVRDPHGLGSATLAALEQNGTPTVGTDAHSLRLRQSDVAVLEAPEAKSLGLPPDVPFTLEIESVGALGRTIELRATWLQSGRRVREASVDGVFLHVGTDVYRLRSPIFEVFRDVVAFNGAADIDIAQQTARLAPLQELIDSSRESFTREGLIKTLRIAGADAFSIDFALADGAGVQIAPVPLRRIVDHEKPDNDDVRGDRLLSSREQRTFERSFGASRPGQAYFIAGDAGNATYVVVTPKIAAALDVVREARRKSPAERVAFARDPYAGFITAGIDDAATYLVEGRSFSDRVIGIGVLDDVALPWQTMTATDWLPPETVTITTGGTQHAIPTRAIDSAIVDIERAIVIGAPTVAVENVTVPASEETRTALSDARSALDAQAASRARETELTSDEGGRGGRIGLQIHRNLEDDEFHAERRKKRLLPIDVPRLKTALKSHQEEAVCWLQRRYAQGDRGALLADDMGLGKTLSCLAFMVWLNGHIRAGTIEKKPILIVAPVSLLDNWQNEHARHVGEVRSEADIGFADIRRAYGSDLKTRRHGRGNEMQVGSSVLDMSALTTDRFDRPTAVLTTYETLRDYQQSFAGVPFALVVLDEAQRIKSPASLTHRAVGALNADFVIAVTGTPVENRLADLWAIADAVQPGFLGILKEFSNRYERDASDETVHELRKRIESPMSDEAPFLMRRMKADVLSALPEKRIQKLARFMPPVQRAAYASVVASRNDLVDRRRALEVLQRIRAISLHPLTDEETDVDDGEFIGGSARFISLFAILDEIHVKDEKVLIFVDRNRIEHILAGMIQRRYGLGALPPIINGEVPGTKRQQLVDSFQGASGFATMILSPKAGGVGLTLTAANHVVHLSRWWNPAVEDQSTDRAYRIGQQRTVHVYHLQAIPEGLGHGCFDEKLDELLERKRLLSHDILRPMVSDECDAVSLLEGLTG